MVELTLKLDTDMVVQFHSFETMRFSLLNKNILACKVQFSMENYPHFYLGKEKTGGLIVLTHSLWLNFEGHRSIWPI